MKQTFNQSVTVIIRTKNSAETIGQVMTSLFSQTYQVFDVKVVDSGSIDNTLMIVKEFPCTIREIAATDYFPGKILNEMIAETKSEIIVFLNSDTVLLTPDVLESLLDSFSNPDVVAAFGRQLPRPDAHTWVRRDYAVSFPDCDCAPFWMHLSLPLAAMRRSFWEKHPFYQKAWGSEDNEWGYWAKQNGYQVKYVPQAIVMHSHNYTLKQLYGRKLIEGEADAFIFRNSYVLKELIKDTLKAILRDTRYYVKERDLLGIPFIPIRRFIYYWGYYIGHRLGCRRLQQGCQDASIGQRAVLKRYD